MQKNYIFLCIFVVQYKYLNIYKSEYIYMRKHFITIN